MIEIRGLHKAYGTPGGGTAEVLRGIDLLVPDRCITAVVGPSGSGKTTLSRCISLLDRPSAGSVLLDGTDLSRLTGEALRQQRRAIGTIFQSSALLRRRTAAENVALPLRFFGVTEAGIRRRVAELLDSVGLSDKADHYPGQLSGGQKQRVGIARALALGPQMLLSDEATSGLDPEATEAILTLLRQLTDRYSLSVVLITHEMDVVRGVADQVAVLRQGRIVEQGSVGELVADPASAAGGQLLPVGALLPGGEPAMLRLDVRYAADRSVPADWINRLCDALPVRVSLLGGSVQLAAGGTVGRLTLGVSWRPGSSPGTADVLRELSRLGLNAAVLREAACSPTPEYAS